MAEDAWICPWALCSHDQAQACRAERLPSKGCGGRFPEGTTLEQAKQMIGPRNMDPQSLRCNCGAVWRLTTYGWAQRADTVAAPRRDAASPVQPNPSQQEGGE
jgi:hypothetical protein